MRILPFLLGTLLTSYAGGQTLLEEHFDYVSGASLAGQINPSSGQTWDFVGAAGSVAPTIGTESLSYPNLAPSSGNSAMTDRNQAGSARIELVTGQISGTVYYSALVRMPDTTGLTNATTGSFFAGLSASTGSGTIIQPAGAALLIRRDPENAFGVLNFGISVSTNSVDRVFSNAEILIGQTVFIVVSYTFNPNSDDDVAQLWIDPDPATFGTDTPPAPTTSSLASASTTFASDSTSLASFFLRNNNLNNVDPPPIQVDEVRVDNGWAGVTVIPEPGTATLITLSLAGLAAHRRRCGILEKGQRGQEKN